ncbi:hypothetical protein ACJJTC_005183, partial [Scirpophaga incertulas]
MEVQEIATNFRESNAMLVPRMLKRLHELRNKNLDDKQASCNTVTPPNQTRHFARFDKKRGNDLKCNGPNVDRNDRDKDEGGGGDMLIDESPHPKDPETPVKNFSNGNIQVHPPTDATRQMLILRYLTPMGEYQE